METDKLDKLFQMQKALNFRIGVDTNSMSEEDQIKWILNYTRALGQEVAELVDSVPWKWWAKYQTYNKQNARVEIVDMFHFLISLAQVLGMNSEDVYQAYMEKHRVNVDRQESGYTVKDQTDSEHI